MNKSLIVLREEVIRFVKDVKNFSGVKMSKRTRNQRRALQFSCFRTEITALKSEVARLTEERDKWKEKASIPRQNKKDTPRLRKKSK